MLHDGRAIEGTFLAFDKHLNLVLSEAEEFRATKSKRSKSSSVVEEKTEKRHLGLVLIRGENVESLAVQGPPPNTGGLKSTPGGPGQVRGAGRGIVPSSMGGQGHQGQHGQAHGQQGPGQHAPAGLGGAPTYGMGGGFAPPPPPPGAGMPPPGMGRGY
jgi:small nuclear ribonucleoprotein B and B'